MEGPAAGFPSVVPRAAAAASPGTRGKHILRPLRDPLNRKVWAWAQRSGRLGREGGRHSKCGTRWTEGLWESPAGQSPPSARPRAWRPAGDKSLSGSSGPRRPRKPPRRRGPAGAGAGGAGGHLRGRRRPKKEGARGRSLHPATPNRDEPGGSGRGMRQQPALAGPAPLGRKVGSCLAPGAPRLSRASLPGTRTPAVPAQRSERGLVPRNHTRSGAERWSPPGGLGTAVSLHH